MCVIVCDNFFKVFFCNNSRPASPFIMPSCRSATMLSLTSLCSASLYAQLCYTQDLASLTMPSPRSATMLCLTSTFNVKSLHPLRSIHSASPLPCTTLLVLFTLYTALSNFSTTMLLPALLLFALYTTRSLVNS